MVNIGSKLAHAVAGNKAKAYEPKDPQYEQYEDARGRQKRRNRQMPEGLSPEQARILKKVRKRAHRLDKGMSLCGLRVGWTFWLGLIPFAGDIADFLLGYNLVIKPAMQCDLPPLLKERMLANQMLATGVGMIPWVGDIIMATIKPNSRNAWLLEEYLISQLQKQGHDATAAKDIVQRSKSKGFWNKKTGEPAQSSATGTSSPAVNGNATV